MADILLLPGDGIGPEVVDATEKVLRLVDNTYGLGLNFETAEVGGASIDAHGEPLTDANLQRAINADAVLLGAVGGPKWEAMDYSIRPERALLALRKELKLYANLRPAFIFDPLLDASSLRREVVSGTDMLVVRELTGGIYFGGPRGVTEENGVRIGRNTLVYDENEVARIAVVAFEAARKRRNKVTSVDKANVLEVTELWRTVVEEVHAKSYSDVELNHMYVDNAAMQFIRQPTQFDVVVTGNMFGDILSDAAAMLTGSIGMLPSASVGLPRNEGGHGGMYEPVHGSAPDIAGQDKANPLATILSAAMLLRYALDAGEAADAIDNAVRAVLDDGDRTGDIVGNTGATAIGCQAMADKVCAKLGA